MHILEPLTRKGKGIEIYGFVSSEYGYTELYALDDKGEKYTGDKKEPWLSRVPKFVKQTFPDIFK